MKSRSTGVNGTARTVNGGLNNADSATATGGSEDGGLLGGGAAGNEFAVGVMAEEEKRTGGGGSALPLSDGSLGSSPLSTPVGGSFGGSYGGVPPPLTLIPSLDGALGGGPPTLALIPSLGGPTTRDSLPSPRHPHTPFNSPEYSTPSFPTPPAGIAAHRDTPAGISASNPRGGVSTPGLHTPARLTGAGVLGSGGPYGTGAPYGVGYGTPSAAASAAVAAVAHLAANQQVREDRITHFQGSLLFKRMSYAQLVLTKPQKMGRAHKKLRIDPSSISGASVSPLIEGRLSRRVNARLGDRFFSAWPAGARNSNH